MPKARPGATGSYIIIAYAWFQTWLMMHLVLVIGLGQGALKCLKYKTVESVVPVESVVSVWPVEPVRLL